MLSVRTFFIAMVILGIAGVAYTDEKISAAKLIGKWTLIKSEIEPLDAGDEIIIEFTKDGKANAKLKIGKDSESLEGTYKLDGAKLSLTKLDPKSGKPGKQDNVTIDTLTDTELVVVDEKGKKAQFSKVVKK